MNQTSLNLNYEPEVIVDTDTLSREDWLSYRKLGIGGSDVAAIMGITLYYLGACWYFPNRQNKKSLSTNLLKIERNEVKQYGNEICRARYGTVFWNS